MYEENTKKFSLNSYDLKKIGKGLLIACGGAALTYLTTVITNTDFGPVYTPLIMAVWSVIVNATKQYFSGK